MDRYPDIEIDIVASNRMVDVTDAGFDAGIRYGGTVPEDMVARRLSADIRWVIAASPDYLERYGTPEHPDDLLHHRCISNRLGDDRVYRWELARDGETYQMTVPGSVTVNHAETGLVAVLGGAGLMYFPEPLVAPMSRMDGSVWCLRNGPHWRKVFISIIQAAGNCRPGFAF